MSHRKAQRHQLFKHAPATLSVNIEPESKSLVYFCDKAPVNRMRHINITKYPLEQSMSKDVILDVNWYDKNIECDIEAILSLQTNQILWPIKRKKKRPLICYVLMNIAASSLMSPQSNTWSQIAPLCLPTSLKGAKRKIEHWIWPLVSQVLF